MIRVVLQRYGTLIALFVLIAGFSLAVPEAFASRANVLNLLQQVTTLAIAAVGATFVMAIGEFDLSVGFVASLAAVLAFVLLGDGAPVALAFLVGILSGLFAGVVNGVLVA